MNPDFLSSASRICINPSTGVRGCSRLGGALLGFCPIGTKEGDTLALFGSQEEVSAEPRFLGKDDLALTVPIDELLKFLESMLSSKIKV